MISFQPLSSKSQDGRRMTMAKNRITIRDLAGLSDVSTATVSRYIHRNGYVSKENAAKILQMAK